MIGDVQGQLAKLTAALRGAGLIAPDLTWAGGEAALWFLGDLVDRGPNGITVVELVMRLQREAAEAGGKVGALLGNHDALLLTADRFGDRHASGAGATFRADWERNGGLAADLAALTPRHVAWLQALSPLAAVGDTVLAHADALFYLAYGRSIAEVNAAFARQLRSDDAAAWDRLLREFSERLAFRDDRPDGAANLDVFSGTSALAGSSTVTPRSPCSPGSRRPKSVIRRSTPAAAASTSIPGCTSAARVSSIACRRRRAKASGR